MRTQGRGYTSTRKAMLDAARTTLVLICLFSSTAIGQDDPAGDDPAATEDKVEVADKVEVIPENSDGRIALRIQDILEATGWFRKADVEVREGVVFLTGMTDQDSHRDWAEQTAMRTSDVVAVVNRITVTEKPLFDLKPAADSLYAMLRELVTSLPRVLVAIVIVVASYFLARLAATITRRLYTPENESRLLRQIVATVVGVIVFLIGLHIALRASGLTRLATTLLGGTGLIGLAIGFAFRDIAENFLSSILLSLSRPFGVGDLIEVDGTVGYVRRVTIRATILATFEGNQVQIPNSVVYKGKVTNFTATPLRRRDFTIGIGFDDSAQQAQELVMEILTNHEAVESEPEPAVLVTSLGSSTVNLQALYWFNQKKHSGGKVNSVLIRRVKQTLQDAGITMPDEARELVFPTEVPVRMIEQRSGDAALLKKHRRRKRDDSVDSIGEGDLHSEAQDVNQVLGEQDGEQDNLLEQEVAPSE